MMLRFQVMTHGMMTRTFPWRHHGCELFISRNSGEKGKEMGTGKGRGRGTPSTTRLVRSAGHLHLPAMISLSPVMG